MELTMKVIINQLSQIVVACRLHASRSNMNLCPVSIALLVIYSLITSRIGSTSSTHFTGDVSINCGSTRASAARNGRQWLGDLQLKHSFLLQIHGKSTTSTVTNKLALDDPVPHETARISRSQFSYAFQVEPGQKIIRLHFNPSLYKGFRGFKDLFTVQSGGFTLLSNFSASLTADALGVNNFAKEYCLSIQKYQQLTITFTPETSQSLDAYAFINGIEIVLVPAAISYFDGDIGLQVVGEKSMIYVDNNTALEIIQRQNIKQDPVSSDGDLASMFPKWATQEAEKKKKSSTWKIPVGVGFSYLVRLPFSEVGLKIAGTGDLRFKVLINEMIAQTNSDMLRAKDGNHVLLYRDYIVMMRGIKTDDKRDILITVLSYDELRVGHGVLAGFEIVKLSNLDNSLASPNLLPPPKDSSSKSIPYMFSFLGIMKFDPSIIAAATNQFSSSHKIGEGGFASVYKAVLPTGGIVAVKRFSSSELALVDHYRNETISVSSLHHQNIIKLLGYYIHEQRGILLYEFMENGSLDKFIFDELRPHQLQWSTRFKVIIGIAKGVIYLHQESRPKIIHRDLNPSNILLDSEMNPKISGFGLARNIEDDLSELSIIAAHGYTSPECITQERISEKEDVYSFGVLVLEILSGKKTNGDGENLIEYAWKLWIEGIREVLNLVDRSLGRAFSEEEALLCIQVGLLCTQSVPHHRPTMPSVLKMLLGEELSLQEMATEQCSTNTEADGAFNSENDRPEPSILAYFPNISERQSQFQPECSQ